MNTIQIDVEGVPKGQPRARACIRGRHAGVYDPGTADDWKACVRAAAMKARKEPIVDAVSLRVVFRMPRPKAHFDKNGEVRDKFRLAQHVQKPDLDNLVKAVQDALTDVGLWQDDAQIVSLTASRVWCPKPHLYRCYPGCSIVIHW